MANTVLLSRNGTTIYPATILDAIIDPNTGKPVSFSGSNITYTINNQEADENGNFTLTAEFLGAAPSSHPHNISDINGLQKKLDEKSDKDHPHDVVTSINVNNSVLTGDIRIEGKGNISVIKNMNNIVISVTPFIADITNEIEDSNRNEEVPFQMFVGTQEEYESFKSEMVEGKRYLVLIRS